MSEEPLPRDALRSGERETFSRDFMVLAFAPPSLLFPHRHSDLAPLILMAIAMVIGKLLHTWYFAGRGELQKISTGVDPAFVGRDFTKVAGEQHLSARQELAQLSNVDENFSLVLFEDFACSLFATAHEACASGKIDALWPYISPAARVSVRSAGTRLGDVAVEAIRYEIVEGATVAGRTVRVGLQFTATCAAMGDNGVEHWRFVERWRFSRDVDVHSKAPDLALALACPNCGAPLGEISAETCAHCNQVTGGGRFDWYVDDVTMFDEKRITTFDMQDEGEPPSIVSPRAEERCRALALRDPAFSWDAFEKRVDLILTELGAARAMQDWKRARPFVSDGLFRAESARMDARARGAIANAIPTSQFLRLDITNVESDKFFDAIAVRVWSSQTVAGRSRECSEYWTLLRGRGRSGAATTEKKCPSCGGALEISMAGSCKYCSANIASGQFDWVLGRIESAHAYAG